MNDDATIGGLKIGWWEKPVEKIVVKPREKPQSVVIRRGDKQQVCGVFLEWWT